MSSVGISSTTSMPMSESEMTLFGCDEASCTGIFSAPNGQALSSRYNSFDCYSLSLDLVRLY
jgi:hypothetical protein